MLHAEEALADLANLAKWTAAAILHGQSPFPFQMCRWRPAPDTANLSLHWLVLNRMSVLAWSGSYAANRPGGKTTVCRGGRKPQFIHGFLHKRFSLFGLSRQTTAFQFIDCEFRGEA
jgi:hypothetical protein